MRRFPPRNTRRDETFEAGAAAEDLSSIRPLAAELPAPRRRGGSRWSFFFVGVVCGALGATSTMVWAVRTHRWNLGAPEGRAAAPGPVEHSPPLASARPISPPPACPSASPLPEAEARGIERTLKVKKGSKKKPHAVSAAASPLDAAPALSVAEPPGPPPEEQAAYEISDWLK